MQDLDKRDFATRYAAGAQTRSDLTRGRAPLPDIDNVSEFSRPFREWMGAALFNDIWNRPGLGHRERCLIVLALLAAAGRQQELRNYVGLALDVGVTRDEIQEVFLQCVAYCGTLAGVAAFPVAEEVFAQRDGAR
jgi:alkylhydroperoxidase/carboxymuconolactone decarboxylase family protein YurZ